MAAERKFNLSRMGLQDVFLGVTCCNDTLATGASEQTCSIQAECHKAAVTVILSGLYWTDMHPHFKEVTAMLYITLPCQLSWITGA